MTNINRWAWDYIDHHIEIKKLLIEDLVNVSALARKIAREHHLEQNIDAIISAIRRYEGKKEIKKEFHQLYELLRRAKISTKTKLVSILVRRTDETEKKVASMYPRITFRRDAILRTFEITNHIKIVVDAEYLTPVKDLFMPKEIEHIEKNLGELAINYSDDITKISGLFVLLCNELALHDISIIDSMICHWEHIIIFKEEDLERAFQVIFQLTKMK